MIETNFPKFTEGFMVGIGLFSALGPKDSFILQRSLSKQTSWAIVYLFIWADILLIGIGSTGVGTYLEKNRPILRMIMAGSVLYLIWFGLHRLWAAANNRSAPTPIPDSMMSDQDVLRAGIVLSFANPYAWIDTVVIIGALASAQIYSDKMPFTIGSMCASFLWFNALALGSAYFSPLFQGRLAWRVLDIATALIMFYFAATLIMDIHW